MKEIIKQKVFELTQLKVPRIPDLKRDRHFYQIYSVHYSDPKFLGVFAGMITKLDLIIYCGKNGDVPFIKLEYKYDHPSGSNGYTQVYSYRNGKWVV